MRLRCVWAVGGRTGGTDVAKGCWSRPIAAGIVVANRFAGLEPEDEDDDEEFEIHEVAETKGWKCVGKGEVVVDSGAAESVCPWDWAPAFPTKEVPWDKKRKFVSANGGMMKHYGEKVFCRFSGVRDAMGRYELPSE